LESETPAFLEPPATASLTITGAEKYGEGALQTGSGGRTLAREEVLQGLKEIIAGVDINSVSLKMARRLLADRLQCDPAALRLPWVKEAIVAEVSQRLENAASATSPSGDQGETSE
jgi:hypothetical protein